MITVGFGDIVATNVYEIWFSIVAMLVGAIVFGYVIGTVGMCFASITASSMRHNARLGEMVAYLKHNKVPTALFTKACQQYDYYLKRKSAFDEDVILGELTESLRQEVGLFARAVCELVRSAQRAVIGFVWLTVCPSCMHTHTQARCVGDRDPWSCCS
jgi:hypothetical protein